MSNVAKLRQHFHTRPRLQNAEYREMFKLSRYAAVGELRRLVDEGFLRIEGERRGAHYVPQSGLSLRGESAL